ncbi:MAG: S8 family serine peptidase [Akkermansiaceae bacterium]
MSRGSSEQVEILKYLGFACLLALVGVGAYLITISAITETEPATVKKTHASRPKQPIIHQFEPKSTKSERPLTPSRPAQDESFEKQRAITFSDSDAMEEFLKKMNSDMRLLGRIDQLNTLLIGFNDLNGLESMLGEDEESSMIYPVTIPPFENVGAQAGSAPLGSGLLDWLGIEADHSLNGAGMKIAVLDTGIADHVVFSKPIERINLVPLPENAEDLNAHGTAVASLIFSGNPQTPGVAPGATPLSVRIADDNGNSNSFLISQGIIAAVDAGAQIINISMGGQGKSNIVDSAVAYAEQQGAVIVASAGNSGTEGVMQPAANPSVIAVGAVDAKNNSLDFSTTGSEVDVSAPGYEVATAFPGDMAAQVNGTSFSAPITAGVIAGLASSSGTQNMTAKQAAALMLENLNDVETIGKDDSTGGGVPDMGRLANKDVAGRYDASINHIYTTDDGQVQVLVQNLGTETLINAGVSVALNGIATTANITTLAPGESRVISVPAGQTADLNIQSSVQLSGDQVDQRPANDSRSQTIPSPP